RILLQRQRSCRRKGSMPISKTLLLVCAALCAVPAPGADSETQLKAREALQRKVDELQRQPPSAGSPVTAARSPAITSSGGSGVVPKARGPARQKMEDEGLLFSPVERSPARAVPAPV